MTVPGTNRASGSCPAGCMAEVGLWWWRQRRRTNGGSRCQNSPIRNSSFCPRPRSAMIAELNCRRTSRAKRPERLSISSSAPACWRRSAPPARSRSGAAMTAMGRWRFASPSRASKRSTSRARRRPLPSRQASARLPPTKSKHPQPRPSPPASGFPLQRRSRLGRSITRARRRPRLARRAKPAGLETSSRARDAGPTGGSDDCCHHARDPLAAALGPRLLRRGGAQEARP